MKLKKQKNKKNKVHLKFDPVDRKTYLLGFRKRKQERKDKAQLEMNEKIKADKKAIKEKRMAMIRDMLESHVPESEEDDDNYATIDSLDVNPTTVSQCGNSTIEISNLSTESKLHLGANNIFTNEKKTTSKLGKKSSFILNMVSGTISKKTLKNNLFRAAHKDAEKSVKATRTAAKIEKRRSRKKKIQVTKL